MAGGPILFSTLPRGERKEGEEDHQERHTKKRVNITQLCLCPKSSVSDPYSFDTDPDPAF